MSRLAIKKRKFWLGLAPTTVVAGSLVVLVWVFFMGSADATTIYVDKDNACPGSGSTRNPYCSIQNALNHTGLVPGDHIKIRDAASAYDESSTTKSDGSVDGTASNPIVIEPD